jgi:hypothetical protein
MFWSKKEPESTGFLGDTNLA